MTPLIVVAALVAGAVGALLRYGLTHAFRLVPERLPWAVLLVNILGSLIGGIAVALSWLDQGGVVRLIALSGFAGGLTTFSTFSVESVQLALAGRWRAVAGSVLGNVLGGIAAFAVGWYASTTVVLGFLLLRTG